jgi:hypothetical protein
VNGKHHQFFRILKRLLMPSLELIVQRHHREIYKNDYDGIVAIDDTGDGPDSEYDQRVNATDDTKWAAKFSRETIQFQPETKETHQLNNIREEREQPNNAGPRNRHRRAQESNY